MEADTRTNSRAFTHEIIINIIIGVFTPGYVVDGERAKVMKPDSGIMVSDFIDEHNGFLSLTDEEYVHAKQVNHSAKNYAHQLLE